MGQKKSPSLTERAFKIYQFLADNFKYYIPVHWYTVCKWWWRDWIEADVDNDKIFISVHYYFLRV